jgi:hypothetical protein
MAVNYCSFLYKDLYQSVAARRRHAALLCRPWEDITPAGLIRCLSIKADTSTLNALEAELRNRAPDGTGWHRSMEDNRLRLRARLLPLLSAGPWVLVVGYHVAVIQPRSNRDHPFQEIRLDEGRRLFIQRQPAMTDNALRGDDIRLFTEHCLAPGDDTGTVCRREGDEILAPFRSAGDAGVRWIEMYRAEVLRSGFQEYF